MFGDNPKRPPEAGDGSVLKVTSLFPTLQGEGPFTGHPAVFVRLGGCNLACSFCDTEFEEFTEVPTAELLAHIQLMAYSGDVCLRNLVVITGGEPLRQNIAPLCAVLIKHGYTVQIETNGTLWRDLPEEVHVICSPKTSGGTYHPLREDLLKRIDALKFIISADETDYREVGEVGQAKYRIPVYVQPMDQYDEAKNNANMQRTLELATARGYRLSLQTHKLLGIP